MKTTSQGGNLDPTTLNIATFNEPAVIAETTADGESYMPYVFEHPIFSDFNASLPGKNILDLGCGPGILSRHYFGQGYNVMGIDFSENMIKAASKNCPKCHFVAKNALDLSPADGRFDGVVAFHLAQYLDRTQMIDLFKKVSDVLSEGGKFLLTFTNTCHPKSGYNKTCSGRFTEYWRQWKIEDITPLFKKGGLKIIKFEQPKLADGDEPFFFVAQKCS
ncbi:MAG: class I SAM-dependent methyltransferase [Candidatus Nomurabacteria bacterium]|jgi:2-polyprenyl-3-methyl-5-hydroxy-6-metoxy-1,4-benzoquinol methylase|nr:class I SAM-dependent methyltransferase [Candidatus Nomurabacteria bacterium]